MTSILSKRRLASILGVPPSRLEEIADEIALDHDLHYSTFSKTDPKKNKARTFHNPKPELKRIQKAIDRRLLREAMVHTIAHGGVRGRSPRSNAEVHLGKPCVVTVDVRDFFPSVRHYMVYRLLRAELGCGRDVARLLTRLTTLASGVPQGAPTSTTISNLLLSSTVDERALAAAGEHRIQPTRFVDDFAFSGENPRPLINVVAKALSGKRLRVWRAKRKLRIMPQHGPQIVTGLIVNSARGPSVPRGKRDAVKAAIFQLRKTASPASARAIASIRGRIQHIARFNPGTASRLERYLAARLAHS